MTLDELLDAPARPLPKPTKQQVIEEEVFEGENLVTLLPDVEVDDTLVFDDEDFWEAIDLMEGARKQMRGVLLQWKDIPPGRRNLLQRCCDDLGHFVSEFLVIPTKETTK